MDLNDAPVICTLNNQSYVYVDEESIERVTDLIAFANAYPELYQRFWKARRWN